MENIPNAHSDFYAGVPVSINSYGLRGGPAEAQATVVIARPGRSVTRSTTSRSDAPHFAGCLERVGATSDTGEKVAPLRCDSKS